MRSGLSTTLGLVLLAGLMGGLLGSRDFSSPVTAAEPATQPAATVAAGSISAPDPTQPPVTGDAAPLNAAPLPGIVFVGGPVVDDPHEKYPSAYDWRDGYVYPKGATNNGWERTHSAPRPGKNLFALVPATPDGQLTQLTFLKNGNVYDPEPSFDGRKILFSMRPDNDDWYHLFEINIDGTGLRQLTDGPFNDVSGVYLPDGRIVFCSDRSGVIDEYHEERSEFLFRMHADGSHIEQLTFVPGIYFEPTVLQNGMILCSFWDAFHISVPPFIKHETYLITLRPDGTEERHYFGAGENQFYHRDRHSGIGLTKPGEMPDGRILVQSEMGPSLYDPNLGMGVPEALTPIFPGMSSVQTGGTTHKIHLSPLGTRSTPYPLHDGRFLLAGTPPGSRDFGLYVADPNTRAMQRVFDRPNLSEWDPVPVAVERPRPRLLPDKPREQADSGYATFVVVAGRHSDTAERNELNRRARFVRVLQAEYSTVTTASHTSLETRILGTVPLLPDGSVAFQAPADTPLFLETLDARGHRLVLQAGYMAARAGEVKSCFGCHAPQSEAASNAPLRALQLPLTRIDRDSTDLSYRRNDPDEYRRHALITQAPHYRTWLMADAKADPHGQMRRRGLELLGYLPDEVTAADRARFAELLTDPLRDVRRQAAHTLAVTGSADQIPALLRALSDTDWQTQHYAAMALEAITGTHLELAADITRAEKTWTEWWQQVGSVPQFVQTLAEPPPFADEFARDAWLEAVGRTRWLSAADSVATTSALRPALSARVRERLTQEPPAVSVVRAAGLLADPQAVALIAPWLYRGERQPVDETAPDSIAGLDREVRGTALAKAAAEALGRIATPEAVDALWSMLAKTVPNRGPVASRHYQTGPRPEEYGYLRALIYANATPTLEQTHLLVALLPSTFGEKPRFEDRTHIESQRVTLPRILLERAGLRAPAVQIASAVLAGSADPTAPLYQQLLKGLNVDRPYSEHGHPFPVLKELAAEQALQFLACLTTDRSEIPEPLLVPLLKSANHRERIETAVVLRRFGFGLATAAALLAEIDQPYEFREIWSIGKGRYETNFRDKSYMLMALAAHTADLSSLSRFTDYTRYFRDIRLGLAMGLGFRNEVDPTAIALLQQLAADPVFSVHRECENSAIALRDTARLQGREIAIALPKRQPLKPEYTQIPAFTFTDRTPDPRALPDTVAITGTDSAAVLSALASLVDAKQYRSVGNTFARNAERMRIFDSALLERTLLSPAALQVPLSPELEQAITQAIDSPFPFAHYLVSRYIASRQETRFASALIARLAKYVEAADTVGFYWSAEALGRLRTPEAIAPLLQFTELKDYPRIYGSLGMAYGFPAARAVGMIAGDMHSETITRLLHSENVWLRSGVIDGLIERRHTELTPHIRNILAQQPGALLEQQARYGLRALAGASER